jgi:hypothetical protein
MNNRLLALVSALSAPIAFLPISCGSDKGSSNGNTIDTGSTTGTITGTTTAAAGTGDGGVTAVTSTTWDNAAASACNGTSTESETMPAKIEMVVDVSSSMKNTTTGSTLTKWQQTQTAIVAGFVGNGTTATGLPDSVAVGLLFYPNVQTSPTAAPQDVTKCVNTSAAIPMATLGADVAGSQRQKLRDALNGIVLKYTGTPTWDAMNYAAYTELLQKAASVSGNPYVVLITDGVPTVAAQCTGNTNYNEVDSAPIVDLITKLWTDKGVKTFLIGSPESEGSRPWLSKAAVAGQTAKAGCEVGGGASGTNWCHMDLTQSTDFGADLTAALKAIAGSVMSCEYDILSKGTAGGTVDANLTVVLTKYSNGTVEMVNRDDTPADCTVGWYINSTTNKVVFCSETCKKVQADANVQLQVLFGCNETSVTAIQ